MIIPTFNGLTKPSSASSGGASLLLDALGKTSIAAYGLRKLRAAYAGSCLRVRRSSDNTESDIGFSGESLDWVAASAFAAGGTLFLVTWYDQSGSSNNLTQATTTLQPQISTSLQRVVFTAHLLTTSLNLTTTNKLSVMFAAAQTIPSTTNNFILFELSGSYSVNNGFIGVTPDFQNVMRFAMSDNTNINNKTAANSTNQRIYSVVFDRSLSGTAQTVLRINGMNEIGSTASASATGNFGSNSFNVGCRGNQTFPYNGWLKEFILLPNALNSTELITGETNMNAFHAIY